MLLLACKNLSLFKLFNNTKTAFFEINGKNVLYDNFWHNDVITINFQILKTMDKNNGMQKFTVIVHFSNKFIILFFGLIVKNTSPR